MKSFVKVASIRHDKVRLAFEAPPTTIIHREEIQDEIDKEARDGTA